MPSIPSKTYWKVIINIHKAINKISYNNMIINKGKRREYPIIYQLNDMLINDIEKVIEENSIILQVKVY